MTLLLANQNAYIFRANDKDCYISKESLSNSDQTFVLGQVTKMYQ